MVRNFLQHCQNRNAISMGRDVSILFLKPALLCSRFLGNTGMCNTCSASELLILYVDCVIGISALCSFFCAFYRTFVPFCGKLLMN